MVLKGFQESPGGKVQDAWALDSVCRQTRIAGLGVVLPSFLWLHTLVRPRRTAQDDRSSFVVEHNVVSCVHVRTCARSGVVVAWAARIRPAS